MCLKPLFLNIDTERPGFLSTDHCYGIFSKVKSAGSSMIKLCMKSNVSMCVFECVALCIAWLYVCMDACMHNGAFNLSWVGSAIHTRQPRHTSGPSLADNAEWVHAITRTWREKNKNTSHIPLSPSFSVACSNSAPRQAPAHSVPSGQYKKIKALLLFFFVYPSNYWLYSVGGCLFILFIRVSNWCMPWLPSFE